MSSWKFSIAVHQFSVSQQIDKSTFFLNLSLFQMSLRWTRREFLGTNLDASHAAANTSSVPSGSPRTSRLQLTTSSQRSFTSCSRRTLHDFSPTSSTSLASVTPAGWWPERMDTTSRTWSVFFFYSYPRQSQFELQASESYCYWDWRGWTCVGFPSVV